MIKLQTVQEKKDRLDAFRPFSELMEQNLDQWYCVELAYHSNAIEGNKLTRQETAQLIEKGYTGASKPLTDYLEARNHAEAYYFILEQINQNQFPISENVILKINECILKGIDDLHAGKFRNVPVRIRGYSTVFPNPLKVPSLMEQFTVWLMNQEKLHPVELAAQAHYRLVSIHPFVDGNGRTARLLMNLILGLFGFPPAIIDISDRENYLSALALAQGTGNMDPFLTIIYNAVERSLDNDLELMSEN